MQRSCIFHYSIQIERVHWLTCLSSVTRCAQNVKDTHSNADHLATLCTRTERYKLLVLSATHWAQDKFTPAQRMLNSVRIAHADPAGALAVKWARIIVV